MIRRQEDMILSTYDQYVDAGGACSIHDYLAPRTRYAVASFRLEHLQYHRLIGYYMSLFGVDRVHVLPFELLRSDATSFVREVRRFGGARADFASERTQAE